MSSVVYEWISEECTWMQQTVLLCALRGCDGIHKEDPSKQLVRTLRSVILQSANPNDVDAMFMKPEGFEDSYSKFLSCLDHYPMHWLIHFIHAAEIVGYKHPDIATASTWLGIYYDLCAALHLNPELENDCDHRLQDSR